MIEILWYSQEYRSICVQQEEEWAMRDSNKPRKTRGKLKSASARTNNVAILEDSATLNPDLAIVVAKWDTIPEAIKTAILAMIRGSQIDSIGTE